MRRPCVDSVRQPPPAGGQPYYLRYTRPECLPPHRPDVLRSGHARSSEGDPQGSKPDPAGRGLRPACLHVQQSELVVTDCKTSTGPTLARVALVVVFSVWGCESPKESALTPSFAKPPSLTPCNAQRTGRSHGRQLSRALQEDRKLQERVIGGKKAEAGSWPWVAALMSPVDPYQYCAGTLIAPEWVLTAAHCLPREGDRVVIGRQDLLSDQGESRTISLVLTHAAYDKQYRENDIALVKLSRTSNQPAPSLVDPQETHAQPGTTGTVVGWGRISPNGPFSSRLLQGNVPIVGIDQCRQAYSGLKDRFRITDNMLCAGWDDGQVDTCKGDSGGPLVVHSAGRQDGQVAGIVSRGYGCGKLYGVYTRVSEYLDWIESCTRDPTA